MSAIVDADLTDWETQLLTNVNHPHLSDFSKGLFHLLESLN
jgi:hypothetical protein